MYDFKEDYQQKSKYYRGMQRLPEFPFKERVPSFKTYNDVISKIALHPPNLNDGAGIWEILNTRRSRRHYTMEKIPFEDFSQLVWATQGVTKRFGNYLLRTAPSAGALYPIETYFLVNKIDRLETGIYHLNIPDWELEFLKRGDYRLEMTEACLGQTIVFNSSVTFLWTAIISRSGWKYGLRCYRYIYMDAGHIAQNLYLACESLGYGCCAIAAFFDDEINELLEIDGKYETIIYLATVGTI